jgi:hypothetical protein
MQHGFLSFHAVLVTAPGILRLVSCQCLEYVFRVIWSYVWYTPEKYFPNPSHESFGYYHTTMCLAPPLAAAAHLLRPGGCRQRPLRTRTRSVSVQAESSQ